MGFDFLVDIAAALATVAYIISLFVSHFRSRDFSGILAGAKIATISKQLSF